MTDNIDVVDGFDFYTGVTNAGTGLSTRYTYDNYNSGGAFASSMQTGRFGGKCVRFGNNSGSGDGVAFLRRGITARTQGCWGFAWRRPTLSASDTGNGVPIFTLVQGTTRVVNVGVNQFGQVTIASAVAGSSGLQTGVFATSADLNVVSPNVWHYFEVEFVHSAVAGRISVYVDGVLRVEFLGNTALNGSTTINGYDLCSPDPNNGANTVSDFDDTYVRNIATRLGERRVETLYMASDVLNSGWSPSTGTSLYATVDESPVSTSDYIYATVVNSDCLMSVTPLSSTPLNIDAVQIVVIGAKTDSTTRLFNIHAQSDTVDEYGVSEPLAVLTSKFEHLMGEDPATGANWDPAAVNSILVGAKLAA